MLVVFAQSDDDAMKTIAGIQINRFLDSFLV